MKIPILLILILCWGTFTMAQQQRALVIGIDKYKPSERAPFPELEGCKNDAQSMKVLAIAKYNFTGSNIKELYDEKATRENILQSMNDLLDKSQKGDVAFIFYAGHGSQVINTLNREDNHLDQSIVPVDISKEKVPDIRNKELAAIFNKFIDKGVILTAIFDCCHSGAMARGIQNRPPRFRYMPGSNWDAKDPSNPVAPDSRAGSNYLILSAVQQGELEEELTDDNDVPHGAFTIALLKAINQQDVNSSVNNLFTAIHAILRSNGIMQEPVKAGDVSRFEGTLFGLAKGKLSNKILIPVITVSGNKVKMQGGMVIGLNEGNELTRVNGSTKIRITHILGPNLSEGEIIDGQDSIQPGEFFEVTNWVSSSAPFLKIYIPDSKLDYEKVVQYATIISASHKNFQLIHDFRLQDPDISFYFDSGKWWYINPGKGSVQLNKFSEEDLGKIAGNKKVNINIPPPQALSDTLKSSLSHYRNLQIVENPNDAQYTLHGTIENNNLVYGLVRTQPASEDSIGMMPMQTKTFELKANNNPSYISVADSIAEYSLRLSKVRGWLNLVPPHDDKFPLRLELKSSATHQVIGADGIKVGEAFELYVVGDKDFVSNWDGRQRYIYVFDIDQSGTMTLLYPEPSSGNINKFPKLDENHDPILEKKLDAGYNYTGSEPTGTDNYYFLATLEAIPNYDIVFNQEGVRGRGGMGSFGELLNIGNAATRGTAITKTPASWSLQRIAVKTTH